MTREDLIEALAEAHHNKWLEALSALGFAPDTWNQANGAQKENTRLVATAGLEALSAVGFAVVPKEPTAEMVSAGFDALARKDAATPGEIFTAMLNAALKEGPK